MLIVSGRLIEDVQKSSGLTGSEYGNRFLGLRNRTKSGISNACTDMVKSFR